LILIIISKLAVLEFVEAVNNKTIIAFFFLKTMQKLTVHSD